MVYGTDDTGARILDAAEQQDGAAKMKWTTPTSYYTVRIPKAIDAKYWNDRLWVNAELAPLDSKGKDNQNWIAVMDAYGGKVLRDSFSQAGYIAGRDCRQCHDDDQESGRHQPQHGDGGDPEHEAV